MISILIFDNETVFEGNLWKSGAMEFISDCKQNNIQTALFFISDAEQGLVQKLNLEEHFNEIIYFHSIENLPPEPDALFDIIMNTESLPCDTFLITSQEESIQAATYAGISSFSIEPRKKTPLSTFTFENFEELTFSQVAETEKAIKWLEGIVEE